MYLNHAGNQNIPSRAEGANLDALGELFYQHTRPAATSSTVTMRFNISEAQTSAVLIPKGTRVSNGQNMFWATVEDRYIAAGQTYGDVTAECMTAGTAGNGYLAGQIATIPTEVQLRELGRPLDDADMMWFFERAIRCDGRPLGLPLYCTDVTTAERIAGRGMQVGSLVSQMTANVVMTPADHYIKRELCAPYYARYMDDMGAIIEGKAAAWEFVEEVDNYLQTNLGLNLNQKTAVIPIGNPVEFVGRKISPVKIELRRQTTLGMKKHLRYVQDAYAAGEIDLDYALSVITSYRGLFKDVTSDAFLEKMLDEFVLSRPALEA